MKAIRVHQFGGPEVLRLDDVDDLHPAADEILVKVMAAGVNPVDVYIRTGSYPLPIILPYTPGFDGAGVVEEVGDNVRQYAAGDRVYIAGSLTGTYAEKALCRPSQIFHLSEKLSFSQGAGIGIPYLAAFRALFTKAKAVANETVFIHGASGGVGVAAIQLAKSAGLRIIATAGSPKGLLLIKQQGADYILDHTQQGYLSTVKPMTGGKGVDIILEMKADINLGSDLDILAKDGLVVVVGCRGQVNINPREIMAKDAMVVGMTIFNISSNERTKIYESLADGFETEKFVPVIGQEFSLRDAPLAQRSIIEGRAFGKFVIQPYI